MGEASALRGHVTMVTLGVADLARATQFYQALGFARSAASQEGISFMTSGTIVVGLFPTAELAKDVSTDVGRPGQGAVALAQNRHSEADVDRVMAEASRAGAKIVKPAQKVFWGGYSGYFADPDGHLWEVAYNPFAELDENGYMKLPGPETAQPDS
ncbi:MAG: VOC family protein [Hyphomicrobiaceae bacterium]